jgi:hypothetical protein
LVSLAIKPSNFSIVMYHSKALHHIPAFRMRSPFTSKTARYDKICGMLSFS